MHIALELSVVKLTEEETREIVSKNAGSSNGRTLDFGSSNRGSSPCPAAKKTFKARAPRKSIAGCCVPGLATLAVATVPSATQGASPGFRGQRKSASGDGSGSEAACV